MTTTTKWVVSLTINVIATLFILYLLRTTAEKYDIEFLKKLTY